MQRLFYLLLIAFLVCAPAFASQSADQFEVKLTAGQSIRGNVGDRLRILMESASIKVVDQSACARKKAELGKDCPIKAPDVLIADFSAADVTEFAAGKMSNFVGIVWNAGDRQGVLVVEPNPRDLLALVRLLARSTGKKVVNADLQSSARPRVYLPAPAEKVAHETASNPSSELTVDFGAQCPIAQVTINSQSADFTVAWNQVAKGLLTHESQLQVYNKNGDLIAGQEDVKMTDGVKGACGVVTTYWAAASK